MTIADLREKCKKSIASVPRDFLFMAILVSTSSASFGLGYLTGLDAGQGSVPFTTSPSSAETAVRQVVASKTGTKYYLPSCTGAERISEANKVWFATAELARAEGYEPATNCAGL